MYPFQRWFPAPASLAASARVWGRPPAHFTVSWSIEEEKYWSTESTVQWCSAAVSMRGPGFDSRHNKGVLHGPSLVTLGCASVNCDYRMRSKTPAPPPPPASVPCLLMTVIGNNWGEKLEGMTVHIPVNLTLERWRQKDQGVQGYPLLQSELEANLSYT